MLFRDPLSPGNKGERAFPLCMCVCVPIDSVKILVNTFQRVSSRDIEPKPGGNCTIKIRRRPFAHDNTKMSH